MRPEKLARPCMLVGVDIRLGDGNVWRMPQLINLDRSGFLPGCREGRDKSEHVAPEAARHYTDLHKRARQLLERLMEHDSDSVEELAETWQLAADALALNYNITPEEIGELGLFTAECAQRILAVLTGWHLWAAIRDLNGYAGPRWGEGERRE